MPRVPPWGCRGLRSWGPPPRVFRISFAPPARKTSRETAAVREKIGQNRWSHSQRLPLSPFLSLCLSLSFSLSLSFFLSSFLSFPLALSWLFEVLHIVQACGSSFVTKTCLLSEPKWFLNPIFGSIRKSLVRKTKAQPRFKDQEFETKKFDGSGG